MKIGVVSDTHIPESATDLPSELLQGFEGVDLILHGGDILDCSVLDELETIAPVHAVRGNMDHFPRSYGLPEKLVVEAEKFRIGLIHGHGAPDGLERRVIKEFDDVHCIVFGHAHRPFNEVIDGVLLFNPGTPTDRRFAPYRSFGILDVADRITGRIIRLD